MFKVAISGNEEHERRRQLRRLKHLSNLNKSVALRHASCEGGNDAFSKDIDFDSAARECRSAIF